MDGVKQLEHKPFFAWLFRFPKPLAVRDEPGPLAAFQDLPNDVGILCEFAGFRAVPGMDEESDLDIVEIRPPHIDRE